MDKFKVIQSIIISSIIRSETVTDVLKLMVLSYLFYNLCWDFDYFMICSDIENGLYDYKTYDFEDFSKFTPSPSGNEEKGEKCQ